MPETAPTQARNRTARGRREDDWLQSPLIPAAVRTRFPQQANHQIVVESALRDTSRADRGTARWIVIEKEATAELLEQLHSLGYTWVVLRNEGTFPAHRESPIVDLL